MGFHYITVSLSKLQKAPSEGIVMIEKENGCAIQAKRFDHND